MPRYRFNYAVETPLRAEGDVTLKHGKFVVTLCLSRPLDQERIPAYTIAEGRNWEEANVIAMEDGFGPALDALCLHVKAPAMLQNLQSVVKAETGATRRAVLIESQSVWQPVNIDDQRIQEVQAALNGGKMDRPALRWLRYSYRLVPVLEQFVFAWLAFENCCGVKAVPGHCPHCKKELHPTPKTDRDEAFRILRLREPHLQRADFDRVFGEWWRELRSAVLHGGRTPDSNLRQRMRAAMNRFRPAVEDLTQQELGFCWAYPGTRTNDGLLQMNWHHFVEFTCAPDTGEFADIPPVPRFAGADDFAGQQVDDSVKLLNFDESKNW
jgi:hypothetical protein